MYFQKKIVRLKEDPGPEASILADLVGYVVEKRKTDDELLQVGRDVQQVQPVADDADDQGTHQGSPDRPLATQQAGTADDGRRDGVEFVVLLYIYIKSINKHPI